MPAPHQQLCAVCHYVVCLTLWCVSLSGVCTISSVSLRAARPSVQPVSKSGVSNFGHLGATIVDAMDTLHIMGLRAEFNQAKE